MKAMRPVAAARRHVRVPGLLALACLLTAGCASSGSGAPVASVGTSSTAGREQVTKLAAPAAARVERARTAALATAHREAVLRASEAKRSTAKPDGRNITRISVKRVAAAEKAAKRQEAIALEKARKLIRRAAKADPSSCLQKSGALTQSRNPGQAKSKAEALKVRAEVLKCLSASEAAQKQLAAPKGSATGTT